MDLSTSRSGNAHLGGLLERSVSADHGSVDGFGLRFAGLLRDVAAVLLVVSLFCLLSQKALSLRKRKPPIKDVYKTRSPTVTFA